MVKMDTLVLFLILGESFQFFTIKNNVCCRLIIYGLYYVDYIMRNAGMEEAKAGIKIAGRNINNLRYADNIHLW